MKKLNFNDILKPTVSLFIICLIVTFLLSGTNAFTKQSIEDQKTKNDEAAKRVVLPTAAIFKDNSTADAEYSIGFNNNGNIEGYIFRTQAKGYGGTIEVMTGILTNSKISGVTILSQNETPGLGANVTKNQFIEQFYKLIPENGFTIKKGDIANSNEINAVTGATISSNAVNEAVNEAVMLYKKISGNGGKINE